MRTTIRKILLVSLLLTSGAYCAVVSSQDSDKLSIQSTNPAKPMVDELQLPNYDTALDSIDYTKEYAQIEWPWRSDAEAAKKREAAITEWKKAKPANDHRHIFHPFRFFGFSPKYDTDIDSFCDFPVHVNDDLLVKTLPHIPEIQRVVFVSTNVTDEGIKSLFYLPLLEQVSLDTWDSKGHPILVSGDGLKLISRHPSLRRFYLSNIDISDETLRGISKNGQNIEAFSVESASLTHKGFEFFENMTLLRQFSFKNANFENASDGAGVVNTVTSEVFLFFSRCPSLKVIGFRDCDFSSPPSEAVIEAIKKMDGQLTSFTFKGGRIDPKVLKTIFELKSLEGAWIFDFRGDARPQGTFPYQRLMYFTRKGDGGFALPDYYEELERPYFEEFYVRTWTSAGGRHIRRAAFVDLVDGEVFLKTTYDGEPFSVEFDRLSKKDQEYVQGVIGPPRK